MPVEITTNNHPRQSLSWFELSDSERDQYDWMSDEDCLNASFYRYAGAVYSDADFMTAHEIPDFEGWHGYLNDTYFSGVLIRFDDYDSVVMGRYYAS
jgi:hypothetical protein